MPLRLPYFVSALPGQKLESFGGDSWVSARKFFSAGEALFGVSSR